MDKNQKGFSIAFLSVVLVIVVAVGSVAYFVYQRQNNLPEVANVPTTQYMEDTDSTGSFSFSYPENWQIEPYVWEDCCGGPPKTEPDWSKETKPITLHPTGNNSVTVSMVMEKYGSYWDSYKALEASIKEDYFAKILFEGQREDGHKALFVQVDYLGPPDAKVESFTDHRYYFDNGEFVLKVEFREKYHHDWPDEETGPDINNTAYLLDFEHIANSIKFLK